MNLTYKLEKAVPGTTWPPPAVSWSTVLYLVQRIKENMKPEMLKKHLQMHWCNIAVTQVVKKS